MAISLVPLQVGLHGAALQQVYRATPGYWQMYNLPGSPAGQATRDLAAMAETPGRTLMGIVSPVQTGVFPQEEPSFGVEMVGVVDFRLHWPQEDLAYIGMVMVAEPYQRQGVGSEAWHLLEQWLVTGAQIPKARLGVEQFNPGALQFFQSLGFALSGESDRVRVGTKWVRVLYMEKLLSAPIGIHPASR